MGDIHTLLFNRPRGLHILIRFLQITDFISVQQNKLIVEENKIIITHILWSVLPVHLLELMVPETNINYQLQTIINKPLVDLINNITEKNLLRIWFVDVIWSIRLWMRKTPRKKFIFTFTIVSGVNVPIIVSKSVNLKKGNQSCSVEKLWFIYSTCGEKKLIENCP